MARTTARLKWSFWAVMCIGSARSVAAQARRLVGRSRYGRTRNGIPFCQRRRQRAGRRTESQHAVPEVQRWLSHHSAAFTLATYVHLLDGDLGEPLTIPQTARNDAK